MSGGARWRLDLSEASEDRGGACADAAPRAGDEVHASESLVGPRGHGRPELVSEPVGSAGPIQHSLP